MTDESLEARLVEAVHNQVRELFEGNPEEDPPDSAVEEAVVAAVLAQLKADGLVLVGVEDLRREVRAVADSREVRQLGTFPAHETLLSALAAFDADTEQPNKEKKS